MRLLVDECCCGCRLRTGAIVIAVISIVNAALMAAAPFSWDLSSHLRSWDAPVPIFKITAGVTAAVLALVSILMLVGAKKGVRGLLLPWLVLGTLYVVLWLGCGVVSAVLLFLDGAFLLGAACFLVALNMTILPSYFLVVVASLHQSLP